MSCLTAHSRPPVHPISTPLLALMYQNPRKHLTETWCCSALGNFVCLAFESLSHVENAVC